RRLQETGVGDDGAGGEGENAGGVDGAVVGQRQIADRARSRDRVVVLQRRGGVGLRTFDGAAQRYSAAAGERQPAAVDQQFRAAADHDAVGAAAGVVDRAVPNVELAAAGRLQQPGVGDDGAGVEDELAGGVDGAA